MNNIISLTKMSFINMKSVSKQLGFILVIWLVVAIFNPLFLNMLFGLTVFVTTYQVMAYEDTYGIDYLISSLPVKRSEYVISRYIMGLITVIFSVIIGTAIYYITPNVDLGQISLGMILLVGVTTAIVSMSIMIPMVLKFGVTKGRLMVTIVMMLVIMVPSFLLEGVLSDTGFTEYVLSIVNSIGISYTLVIFNVIVLAISVMVSMKSYKSKELV